MSDKVNVRPKMINAVKLTNTSLEAIKPADTRIPLAEGYVYTSGYGTCLVRHRAIEAAFS